MATRSLVTGAATSALRPRPGAGMPAAARQHQLLHAIPTQVSATPPMALRSTIAAASARSGAAAAAAARSWLLSTTPSRNQQAAKRHSDVLARTLEPFVLKEVEKVVGTTVRREIARRYLLELAERDDQNMRRDLKLMSRSVKAVKWACYFAISATVAAAVRDAIMPVSMKFYGELHDIPN